MDLKPSPVATSGVFPEGATAPIRFSPPPPSLMDGRIARQPKRRRQRWPRHGHHGHPIPMVILYGESLPLEYKPPEMTKYGDMVMIF
jgi:hypothetical protein